MQIAFANRAKSILEHDKTVLGLAAAGSWLTNELDEFSDLDLIIVTKEKITDSKDRMLDYARKLGDLLSGFTGDHVGEPRLLICMYDNPVLHVDLKFVTVEEFRSRIENPAILFDRNGELEAVLKNSEARFPYPDHQWIEDRFWTWVHYALLKIGRGEHMEASDFLAFLRMVVLGPLLHMKNGNLPRGVRKVETELPQEDLIRLQSTIGGLDRKSLLKALRNSVNLYKELQTLFNPDIQLQERTEERVMDYFGTIEKTTH